VSIAVFALVCLGVCCAAPQELAAASGGAVHFERDVPSDAPPVQIALQHLERTRGRFGLTPTDLADVRVQNEVRTRHNGVTHLYLRQSLGGLEVANAQANFNIAADGRIVSMGNSFVADLAAKVDTLSPQIGAADAIASAAGQLGIDFRGVPQALATPTGPERSAVFSGDGISLGDIPAKLALYHTGEGVRLVWDLVIHQADPENLWNLWVDAVTGEVVAQVSWTARDSYEVFELPKESPFDGPRTIQTNPANTPASPFGWHDTDGAAGAEFTTTRGNNVCAQQDRDGNNSACGTVAQPNGGGTLDFTGSVVPLDLATQQPGDYQDAAVVNLFYWNNIMHDLLYQYGFDEASGNFQENNYGRGGLDGDSVNADAQDNADGGSRNNANFSTPPEPNGPFVTNPRMQMFEWDPPFVNELVVDAPSSAAGSYFGSDAEFGPALGSTGVSGSLVVANDGTGTPSDACEALTNGAQISGNLAVVDRGTCTFVVKVKNAQDAGAVGVVIVNNVAGNPIAMGGTDNTINIPSMMISLADGDFVKAGLPATGTTRAVSNPPPRRDSDLEAGIIAHEYCHGLSTRLTGGPADSSCLSGNQQAGEGWSDLCTLFFTAVAADTGTTPRGVGGYAIFDPSEGAGIRPFPYTTDMGVNPLTYGDLTTAGQTGGLSIPHGVGTVWATAVWEMYWNLTDKLGFDPDLYNGTGGNNVAIQLVVDGLKLQPCDPTFLDARDAILAADMVNNGGANECDIWEAFAKRGMGANASDGGGSNSLNVVENFDLPPQCVSGCGNGICESGEDCNTCPSDCVSGTSSGAVCGNGVCEAGDGEDCVTCPADCNGVQGGKPANRFCCGNGGSNPVGCNDSRCTTGGFSCTTTPVPGGGSFCCGDTFCDPGEDCGNCALDCTVGAEVCTGGIDEDCNGQVDCADGACSTDPVCQPPDCSQLTDKNTCNAQTGCRWDNRSKTCVPN
jgi:hypothetical protein